MRDKNSLVGYNSIFVGCKPDSLNTNFLKLGGTKILDDSKAKLSILFGRRGPPTWKNYVRREKKKGNSVFLAFFKFRLSAKAGTDKIPVIAKYRLLVTHWYAIPALNHPANLGKCGVGQYTIFYVPDLPPKSAKRSWVSKLIGKAFRHLQCMTWSRRSIKVIMSLIRSLSEVKIKVQRWKMNFPI